MEKKTKKISIKNLPVKYPWSLTLVTILLLDRLKAPDLFWGIYITFMVFVWAITWVKKVETEHIDVLGTLSSCKEDSKNNRKSA